MSDPILIHSQDSFYFKDEFSILGFLAIVIFLFFRSDG